MQTCTKWSPFLSLALPFNGQKQACEAPPPAKELLAVNWGKKTVICFQSCNDW